MNDNVRITSATPTTSGMATGSLLLGISSFVCFIVTAIPAIILGIIALRKIKQSGGMLQGEGLAIGGIITGVVSTVLILPIMVLVALLLPAVQAARDAAQRSMSANNMRQISIAMLNYENSHKQLPMSGGGDGPGSQLSWRVHLLPYLEEGQSAKLYEQFHLDEPWDSEHNRALLAKIPDVYKNPSAQLGEGETVYLAVTGEGTVFGDGKTGTKIKHITDGTSRTVALVEANADQAVPWTKPDDWKFDPNEPMKGLGQLRRHGFHVACVDSSVEFILNDSTPEEIRALMTPRATINHYADR